VKSVFALVDCNNFFASCERVFQPALEQRPVAVLSNNDGCVIARSNEVKALGVPMGAPLFKYKAELEKANAAILSANFQLYGDMSWRVTEVLKRFTAHVELFSIDEAFLDISDLPINEHSRWLSELHQTVKRWTGLPVSVGVGPTKTLAKLASNRAKKEPAWLAQGGLSLYAKPTSANRGATSRAKMLTEEILKTSPVMDIWGVGRRLGPKLQAYGIYSAWDLTQANDDFIRREMSVKGLRTVKELRGEVCLKIDENSFLDEQKSIAATRTFGHAVSNKYQLEAAVATFAARVAAKLRRKQQLAHRLQVSLGTGHNVQQRHFPSREVVLPYPTADSGQLISAAVAALAHLPAEGIGYKRGGVLASELVPDNAQQLPLFGGVTGSQLDERKRLMQAVDDINRRYGKETIGHTIQGFKKESWHSQRRLVSPAYTSRWEQIPTVR
jgi:DNA polymerase V